MKKFIILLSALFLCVHFAIAQTEEPPEWGLFVSKSGDFSIETPISLNTDEIDSKDNRTYWSSGNRLYVYVFADKPDGDGTDSGAIAIKYATEHEKNPESVNIDGKKGRQYIFEDEDGYYHRVVSVKSDGVRYVFQAVSDPTTNLWVARFFGSIRLNKSVQKAVTAQDSETTRIEKDPKSPGIANGTGNGGGIGGGMGSGMGSGSTSSATQESSTTNLRILSKPRAAYTDYARTFNISGTITLRVAFLADGTIGEVTPLNKLPFGLLGNAISAARKMRFEPARKEGIPYSKVMSVEYSFTIY